MENLTIKQLLDLGARIEIDFLNMKTKEDALEKFASIGFDGEVTNKFYEGECSESHHMKGVYNDSVQIYATHSFKWKEDK